MSGNVTWRVDLRPEDAAWKGSAFRAKGLIRRIDHERRQAALFAAKPLVRVADALLQGLDILLDPAELPRRFPTGLEVRLPPPVFLLLRENAAGLESLTRAGCSFEVTEAVHTVRIGRDKVAIEAATPNVGAGVWGRKVREPLLDRATQVLGEDPARAWPIAGPLHRRAGLEAARLYLRMRWLERRLPRDFFWDSSLPPQGGFLWSHPSGLRVEVREGPGSRGLPGAVEIRVDGESLELPAPTQALPIPVLRRTLEIMLEPRWHPVTLVLNRLGEDLGEGTR